MSNIAGIHPPISTIIIPRVSWSHREILSPQVSMAAGIIRRLPGKTDLCFGTHATVHINHDSSKPGQFRICRYMFTIFSF